MNMSNFPSGRSPRRELQGPRPAPLKVRKDSHKIKKPPVAPLLSSHLLNNHNPPPPPPIIIYTISPKIIHANPNEFMSLVQRLTGPNSSYASSSSSMGNLNASSNSAFPFHESSGAISPAARFASIEKTKSPNGRNTHVHTMEMEQEVGFRKDIQRTGNFPGILSPNPNALPPIPQNFFSTSSDLNPLGFMFDLSPVLHSNRNCGNFTMPTSVSLASPQINMPSPNTLDLFNTLFDL